MFTAKALLPGTATALTTQDADTLDWQCNFCTYAQGWYGTLDVGPGHVSGASPKFSDYRGIDDAGGFLSLYGDIHYRDPEGRYFDLYARDLGTDSRQLEVRGGNRGRYEIRLAYSELPKYRGFGTRTPHLRAGGASLALPENWVNAPGTSGMSALGTSLNTATLDTRRKTLDAGLSFRVAGNWSYQVDVRHETRDGTRPFGAGVFTLQSSHFPAPVDYTTDRLDMGLEYSGTRSRIRLGFVSTWFNNAFSSVTWANPFDPIGNTQTLRAALEPDSDFYQFNLAGAFSPTPKLRLSGRAAFGRMEQDEAFLPYSINPDFDGLALPRPSLSGKIDASTVNLTAKLTARLTRKTSFTARMKVDERDNRTAVDSYTPVITDLVLRPETPNRPYSFERRQYSAELRYRAHPSASFNAGARQKDHERTLQSAEETGETAWWGEVSVNHWASAQLRFKLEASERDISPYKTVHDPGLQENPLTRKFNLADRDRDRAMVELDLSPTERLGASLSWSTSQDDYEQSVLGLLKSDEESLSLDLSFSINPGLSVHAFISRDEFDSKISGAADSATTPWLATTVDRFTSFGAGLTGKLGDQLDISIDYVSSDSKGRIVTDSGLGEAPFPALRTDLSSARLSLTHRINRQWSWTLHAEHENYASRDWQIDGLGNAGISAILTLGGSSPDYSITALRLLANYRF